jgi:methyl-accepting chemotaxis protein
MRRLAGGDMSIDVPALARADEVGEMARSVAVFRDNAIRANALATEQRAEQEKKEHRQQTMESLTQGFDRNATSVLDAVAASIVEMRATAERMAAVATENTNKASAVASGARETSSNVRTVATATEELSVSVSEISRQVTQSASIAAKAVQEAQETNAEIQGLAAMAQRIGDIVKLINNIASQTNLLALNATIEAARAGDSGRGFAVVASEVRSLAQRSAAAAKEIKELIGDSVSKVNAGTALVDQAGATMDQIVNSVRKVHDIMAEITMAGQRQSEGIEDIGRAIDSMDEMTQQNSALVEEASATAESLTEQTGQLTNALSVFKLADAAAAPAPGRTPLALR